jgi:D-alanyl-D-alanine carboxypeptidase
MVWWSSRESSIDKAVSLELPPLQSDQEHHVRGRHTQALTGELFTYTASFRMLGAMVHWSAKFRERGPGHATATATGSIHLRRGQSRGIAPTLVAHLVVQAIDTLVGAEAPA